MMKYELGMYGSELLSARYHIHQLMEHAEIMKKDQTLKLIKEIDSKVEILLSLYEWYLEDEANENGDELSYKITSDCC